jgi:hypothetical protein
MAGRGSRPIKKGGPAYYRLRVAVWIRLLFRYAIVYSGYYRRREAVWLAGPANLIKPLPTAFNRLRVAVRSTFANTIIS